MKATEKQKSFILHLASKNNMSTEWMSASWKRFTTMKERSGKVTDFLDSLTKQRASEIIESLNRQ